MSFRAKALIACLAVALGAFGFAMSRAMSPSPVAPADSVPVAAAPNPSAATGFLAAPPHVEPPSASPAPQPETETEPKSEPAGSAVAAPLDEAQLMARLRAVKDKDPALAVDLAREGKRRFPDSPEAPERASILIHALGAQGRASDARGEAEHMVNHYPDSTWVREIEQFTGAHRHRNIRVTDAGLIEYY